MNLIKPVTMFAVLCATTLPANAVTPSVNVGGADVAIAIVGYVPVICRAKVDASTIAPAAGTTSLGMLKEFCNSPTGYRVIAEYSPVLASARLIVDGTAVALDASGSTVISQTDGAKIANRTLALELPQDGPSANISFRIEPR